MDGPLETVTIGVEDPRAGDPAALIAELAAWLKALYPEDADDPPSLWGVKELALQRCFVVARVGGAAVGCGGLVPLADPRALEVVRMYVRPEHRGRRLADRIVQTLESLARWRRAEVLMLRCGPRQPEALRLYERNGYCRRPPFAQHRAHPTNVFFEKRL
jgi:putative acetyltransferase